MKKRFPAVPGWVVLCSLVVLSACDTQAQQDEFAEAAGRVPDGYTETTAGSEVISTDSDDWRTSPAYRGYVTVDPAFPNPVNANLVTVPFTIIGFDGVQGGHVTLRAYGPNGRDLILLQQVPLTGPGGYQFSFSPGLLSTKGLHRVFMFDAAGEIISYGDVLVQ